MCCTRLRHCGEGTGILPLARVVCWIGKTAVKVASWAIGCFSKQESYAPYYQGLIDTFSHEWKWTNNDLYSLFLSPEQMRTQQLAHNRFFGLAKWRNSAKAPAALALSPPDNKDCKNPIWANWNEMDRWLQTVHPLFSRTVDLFIDLKLIEDTKEKILFGTTTVRQFLALCSSFVLIRYKKWLPREEGLFTFGFGIIPETDQITMLVPLTLSEFGLKDHLDRPIQSNEELDALARLYRLHVRASLLNTLRILSSLPTEEHKE